MKPKFILISLLFVIIHQNSCAGLFVDKELCKLYEPETDQSITQSLTADPISISQVSFHKNHILFISYRVLVFNVLRLIYMISIGSV